jgi:hypothetical protein
MSFTDKSLKELTKIVFKRKYEFDEEPKEFRGTSGKKWTFDALVSTNNAEQFGVFIRDWKREISITQMRQLRKACIDVPEVKGGIMVCNIASEFSRNFCNQFNIQLISRGHLVSKLRTSYL